NTVLSSNNSLNIESFIGLDISFSFLVYFLLYGEMFAFSFVNLIIPYIYKNVALTK
ncbi:MAG: hypothetical protein XD53_1838, partial [Petrotoga mobilis]